MDFSSANWSAKNAFLASEKKRATERSGKKSMNGRPKTKRYKETRADRQQAATIHQLERNYPAASSLVYSYDTVIHFCLIFQNAITQGAACWVWVTLTDGNPEAVARLPDSLPQWGMFSKVPTSFQQTTDLNAHQSCRRRIVHMHSEQHKK